MNFKLYAPFKPTGDQPQAIEKLVSGLKKDMNHQVLLGVTGSGKTFTLASVIEKWQKPTLVISHNKTLAAQLYQEFRDFFPKNAVNYFVSYYDFYQPEAYIPQTDTYIDKETEINEEIEKLRLATTTNLLTRHDTIVVASVSCIYNIGSPREYGRFTLEIKKGVKISREAIISRLVDLQYQRNKYQFSHGTFRVRGEIIDIFPAYEDTALRLLTDSERIKSIDRFNVLNTKVLEHLDKIVIYPAKHFITDQSRNQEIFAQIRRELAEQVKKFTSQGKTLEAYRLKKRVNYDLEMIGEVGYVNGIENYSRYFDNRKPGEPPYTLLDYFRKPYGDNWLLVIDESHMTIPQIRGMYNGDRSRKLTLVDFGFRLPSALDNRPLTFLEFSRRAAPIIYDSATPDIYEISKAGQVVEQLIRPTGIIDPEIIIRPTKNQIIDLIGEIINRKKRGERVLVTTLTKRTAEDLASYFNEKKYIRDKLFENLNSFEIPNVQYLHSDVETLERSDILDNLRGGIYDVLIGINLLREGLDLPEVSLVAILDADKEGFLRSSTSLIQTMGRAARHIRGCVIMYADQITLSMRRAIEEIERRRKIQIEYNRRHNITPQNIIKPIREKLVEKAEAKDIKFFHFLDNKKRIKYRDLLRVDIDQLLPSDKTKFIKRLEIEMKEAASILNFELAAEIRDKVREICKKE